MTRVEGVIGRGSYEQRCDMHIEKLLRGEQERHCADRFGCVELERPSGVRRWKALKIQLRNFDFGLYAMEKYQRFFEDNFIAGMMEEVRKRSESRQPIRR